MNLSDSFYVALCMTVLILGVVYWFWTQNQYIQRKVNLLENIVYEMKSSMSFSAPDPIDKVLSEHAALDEVYTESALRNAPAPAEPIADGDDVDAVLESLTTNQELAQGATKDLSGAAPTETGADLPVEADEVFEDLTPGGIGSGIITDVSDIHNEAVLNGMGLKELRELAKQKGISGAKTLRKHELVAAIRESKTTVTPFEIREGTLELS